MNIPEIIQAKNSAADLISPDCINWEALEIQYTMNGKERTLAVIEREKEGANSIFLAHLNLAQTAINKLP